MTAHDEDMNVTLGEVFRALGKLEKVVEDGLTKMSQQYVPRELYETEIAQIRAAIAESKESSRWRWGFAVAILAALAEGTYALTHLLT